MYFKYHILILFKYLISILFKYLILVYLCDSNIIVNAIGYSGGIVLSICLIPQIYKIYETKHVENISYLWQFLYILGISLHPFKN